MWYTVIGLFHDNWQPWIEQVEALTPAEASKLALKQLKDHNKNDSYTINELAAVVEVLEGRHQGVLCNEEVLVGAKEIEAQPSEPPKGSKQVTDLDRFIAFFEDNHVFFQRGESIRGLDSHGSKYQLDVAQASLLFDRQRRYMGALSDEMGSIEARTDVPALFCPNCKEELDWLVVSKHAKCHRCGYIWMKVKK